jgi:hypothetical protein
MNAQANIEAVKRMLERKQVPPTAMVRDLATDCTTYRMLSISQAKRIAELEALLAELHDGRGQINYDSIIWKEVGDKVGKVTS